MSFFGIPIRNGLSLGLGTVASLTNGPGFLPSELFYGGTVQGAWYDPSDLTTLFQDSAGTTPVTAVEQPVGLMLDKSKGAPTGVEQLTSSWVVNSGTTESGGVLTLNSAAAGTYAGMNSASVVSGNWYRITFTISGYVSGGVSFGVNLAGGWGTVYAANGTYTQIRQAPASNQIQVLARTSATTAVVSNISVQLLSGNHAYQSTSASRPTLRARYNLLTRSEEFNDAVWTKTNSSAANTTATTDPLGGTTADKISASAVSGFHITLQNLAVAAGTYAVSYYAKSAEYSRISIDISDSTGSNGVGMEVNLTSCTVTSAVAARGSGFTAVNGSITSVGNGWCRVVITATVPAGTLQCNKIVLIDNSGNANFTGDGTSGIFIWGAQLTQPAVFPSNTYQRVGAATDYATGAAFPPYLAFDGVDDSMIVPGSASAMKFMHSDLTSVCIGVNVGASTDPNAQYSFFGTNGGSSAQIGVWSAYDDTASLSYNNSLRNFTTRGVGSSLVINTADQNVVLPITPNVIFYNSDPTNSTAANRYTAYVNNGSALATNTDTQAASTANSTFDLQIGSTGNSVAFGMMNLYSLIIVNSAVTGGQRTATQSWVAAKTPLGTI